MALEAKDAYVSAVNAYREELALWEVALDIRRARGVEMGEAIRVAAAAVRASVEESFADEESFAVEE